MAHGAANAFLTLRVGHIARDYCAPLVRPDAAKVRRSATLAAMAQVGSIAKEQGTRVAQAAWSGVSGFHSGRVFVISSRAADGVTPKLLRNVAPK